MKKLWIMVGAPGSGKSTYLKNHNIPNSVVISRDKIRYSMLKKDDDYFAKEDAVYQKFVKEIAEALAQESITDVFADQTSLDNRARSKLLNALRHCHAQYDELNAIVFKLPIEQVLKQNAQRIGRERVPDNDVSNMYYKMTIPTKFEGFKHVYIYNGERWEHRG